MSYDVPLPPGFAVEDSEEEIQENIKDKSEAKKIYGPIRPPTAEENEQAKKIDQDDSDEDVVVGPRVLTPEEIAYRERLNEDRQQEWEQEEWKRIRDGKPTTDNKSKQRDEWMTKIPEGRGALAGLAPRQFSRKGIGPGKVDESWMESPLDKGKTKKTDDRDYLKEEMEAARQKEMDRLFQEQKQQRGPSLLEIHQQKRKPLENEDKNRPFDRERDLAFSSVDPKKRQKLIQESKKLDSMFEKGGGY